MTNNLNTITGVLAESVDKLEANLNSMGVYATYDPSEGYLALLDEILNIAPSVGGINLSTAISLTHTPSVVKVHDTVLLSATVHADYDDRSQANIDMNGYLQGATVSFYDGNTLLGTGVTGADGVATFTVADISYGSHSFKAEYDGTGTSYDSAVSSVLNVTAEHDYSLEFGQDSYIASEGSCNVTVTLLDNGVPVAGETVSLTGSDSSLYSGITNQNGVASYTFSNISSSLTVTASYNSASATCTIITPFFVDNGVTNDYNSNYTNLNGTINANVSSTGTNITCSTYADCYRRADAVISGDFEITYDLISTTDDNGGFAFLNTSNSILWFVEFKPPYSQINVNIEGTEDLVSYNGHDYGKVKITRIGNTMTVYLDNQEITSKTVTDVDGYFAWKTHSASGRNFTFKDFSIISL